MEPDFEGWATKTNIKCKDGRVIKPGAFEHMDKQQVPLVWQHGHESVDNVLGHAILSYLPEGVRVKGFFNKTPNGQKARLMVQHKDIDKLSIYANDLKEHAKQVLHGVIREVSLVIAGANPGAMIDFVTIQHGDGTVIEHDDIAIIHTGETLENISGLDEEKVDEKVEHADDQKTIKDVYETLNDEQLNVVNYMIGKALEDGKSSSAEHSDTKTKDNGDEGDLSHQEGNGEVKHNVFEQNQGTENETKLERHTVSKQDMAGILKHAQLPGQTLGTAVKEYALRHGVENLDVLFPDAKTLNARPEWIKRRTEWVNSVINGTSRTAFSRVKSVLADLTQDEARAKGYIKGSYKKEQWFTLTKRTTTPTTIYKKQKLDRDDIIDVTDFDIVAWIKAEMRLQLEEELARAILLGDGRDVEDDDKIRDPEGTTDGAGIRSIYHENELYAVSVTVNIDDASSSYEEILDGVIRARKHYKGTGTPTFYTTEDVIVELLLLKDTTGRRLYRSMEELAAELRVSSIVPVEVMEEYTDLIGIIVNLTDYNLGTDRGGEVTFFDDFDIDYNQQKYLIETRLSGALTKAQSALVIKRTASSNALVQPVTKPSFVATTGVVTIPTQTGVVYKNAETNATLSSGAQTALAAGAELKVKAVPASGYYFANDVDTRWTFTRNHA